METAIGLYVNSQRDEHYNQVLKVAGFLRGKHIKTVLCGDAEALESLGALQKGGAADVRCIIALGGDGTLLKAAKAAAAAGTPVLGLNLGRLGYLTDAQAKDFKPSLERLLSGDYKAENRIMLEARWEGGSALALNDAFVGRSGPPKLLTIIVEINGEHMDTYQADGVLVATPTGSTAYNLSAGGPVIKPDADILAITPVCPHALHARGAVISSSDRVTVSVLSPGGGELFMDGERAAKLPQGERAIVMRSAYNAAIIKTSGSAFYDILRQKLGKGGSAD